MVGLCSCLLHCPAGWLVIIIQERIADSVPVIPDHRTQINIPYTIEDILLHIGFILREAGDQLLDKGPLGRGFSLLCGTVLCKAAGTLDKP